MALHCINIDDPSGSESMSPRISALGAATAGAAAAYLMLIIYTDESLILCVQLSTLCCWIQALFTPKNDKEVRQQSSY